MNEETNDVFSEEYNSSEKTETTTSNFIEVSEIETTKVSETTVYTLLKPKRIIINAVIKND
ncbi:MAG: hypothetical protein ACK4R6_08560 [Spirosomataceae bacterium]|jgi:hypothetical protein